jgi:DNA polymerase-1
VLIELDQSQIELRVAAGMSGDPDMINIFLTGQDYHMATAKLIAKLVWNLTAETVTEWHRQYCKTVNFGLLYGKTDAGLAASLGCSLEEAAAVRRAILGRFKKLAEMIKRLLYHVRRYGSIDVPWVGGAVHTRPLYDAGSHDKWKKMSAENASINTPIQGRAAVYTLASIPLIHQWIDENNIPADIVNTVHDSVMLDAAPEVVDTVIENCSRIMTSFDCWGVPLIVDAKAGDRWGSLRKIKRGELFKDAQVRWVVEGLSKSA